MDGLGSVDPLLQMVQCQGVVLHESIKIGLTQAIAGIANGVAQNLQQKNIAQQVGQQGGGRNTNPGASQRSLDGVKGGPSAFEVDQRMEVLAQMEWRSLVKKSWVHTYSNRWVNTVTGQIRYESQAIESVNWELYVMPLPKFGFLRGVFGKMLAREGEVVAAEGGMKAIQAGEYTITKTVAKNLATRPYINSPSTITNIMKSSKGVPDAFFKGGMNYKMPGTFNGANGIFELGINPETNTIYHFLFKTIK